MLWPPPWYGAEQSSPGTGKESFTSCGSAQLLPAGSTAMPLSDAFWGPHFHSVSWRTGLPFSRTISQVFGGKEQTIPFLRWSSVSSVSVQATTFPSVFFSHRIPLPSFFFFLPHYYFPGPASWILQKLICCCLLLLLEFLHAVEEKEVLSFLLALNLVYVYP